MVWHQLGYSNEGQSSNTPLVCIWETTGLIESKFGWIRNVINKSYYIITPSWYDAIFAMQMRVKVQVPLCFVSEKPLVESSPNLVWISNMINQSYYIITISWYDNLAMQMKVKVQIAFYFLPGNHWLDWVQIWYRYVTSSTNHIT